MPSSSILVLGTVLSVQVISGPSWIPRTRVTFLSDDGRQLAFLLPGANGGPPAAVVGVPVIQPGQRWEVELDEALVGLVPRGHGEGMRSLDPLPVWNLNGNHLPAEALPWPMSMQEQGLPSFGADSSEAILLAALEQWSSVGCSSFAFAYQGRTPLGVEDDGVNVVAWESDTWEWHEQAAGMSVLRFDMSGGTPVVDETDILFNAVSFDWSETTGSVAVSPILLHAGSIVAHELGHSTGMDHEYFYASSTMHLAYFGGSWMETLSGDDHRGLCENYPSGHPSCETDDDCAGLDSSERWCNELDGVRVCDELRDPVGSSCYLDAFNCEEACLFDSAFYQQGSCVLACPDGTCEPGFHCEEASWTIPLEPGPICVPDDADTGLDTGPDTGPAPDDSAPPSDSAEPGTPEGCGCGSAPSRAAWAPLLGLLALGLVHRNSARTSPPPPRSTP